MGIAKNKKPGGTGPRNPVEQLAESFLECVRRGEQPAIDDYAQLHPEHADEIRRLFPALLLMERLRPGSDDPSAADDGSSLPMDSAKPGERALPQLGDFQLIREIGRGGMGVVYEAEQVSLGRRVALKVLPNRLLNDDRYRKRFHREARAAGKLHHTNIVPVFGVGEEDGTHFYVMQLIRGLGLDVVLQELREMRQTFQPRHGSDPLRQPLAVDDGSRVIAVAERMVAHDPADNWSHVHLFLTLCQAGQVEEAYRRVRCTTVRRLVQLCHGALGKGPPVGVSHDWTPTLSVSASLKHNEKRFFSRSENFQRDRRWIS